MKDIVAFSYQDEPKHQHDCKKCEFMFSVELHDIDDNIQWVDVYEQCRNMKHEYKKPQYLFRYSSDGPDYISGLNFRHIVSGFVVRHFQKPQITRNLK